MWRGAASASRGFAPTASRMILLAWELFDVSRPNTRRTVSRVLGKLIEEDGLLEWHGFSPNDSKRFYTIR